MNLRRTSLGKKYPTPKSDVQHDPIAIWFLERQNFRTGRHMGIKGTVGRWDRQVPPGDVSTTAPWCDVAF
jgi:hypothetical protein